MISWKAHKGTEFHFITRQAFHIIVNCSNVIKTMFNKKQTKFGGSG